jgi:hypothetical protein
LRVLYIWAFLISLEHRRAGTLSSEGFQAARQGNQCVRAGEKHIYPKREIPALVVPIRPETEGEPGRSRLPAAAPAGHLSKAAVRHRKTRDLQNESGGSLRPVVFPLVELPEGGNAERVGDERNPGHARLGN